MLPGISAILAHWGNYAYAVELLSLVAHHPITSHRWFDKDTAIRKLINELKANLSPKAYNTAWERGKQLDLETVVAALLAEFNESDVLE